MSGLVHSVPRLISQRRAQLVGAADCEATLRVCRVGSSLPPRRIALVYQFPRRLNRNAQWIAPMPPNAARAKPQKIAHIPIVISH